MLRIPPMPLFGLGIMLFGAIFFAENAIWPVAAGTGLWLELLSALGLGTVLAGGFLHLSPPLRRERRLKGLRRKAGAGRSRLSQHVWADLVHRCPVRFAAKKARLDRRSSSHSHRRHDPPFP